MIFKKNKLFHIFREKLPFSFLFYNCVYIIYIYIYIKIVIFDPHKYLNISVKIDKEKKLNNKRQLLGRSYSAPKIWWLNNVPPKTYFFFAYVIWSKKFYTVLQFITINIYSILLSVYALSENIIKVLRYVINLWVFFFFFLIVI